MEQKQEVTSTKQTLRLVELGVQSYGGVHKGMDLVITFPSDKNIVGLKGDQGTGKTSTLRAILSLLGCAEPDNAINSIDKNKSAKLTFEHGDTTYVVSNTKTSFAVSITTKDGVKSKLQSPKENLNKIIGNVALNPMDLKLMDGKKQVQWIRQIMKWTKEQTELESTIKKQRDEAFKSRTEVNRAIKLNKSGLLDSGYFLWDEENKCFVAKDEMSMAWEKVNAAAKNESELKSDFESLQKSNNQYNSAIDKLDGLKQQKIRQEKDIIELEDKLIQLKLSLSATNETIEKGEKFIEENKDVPVKYEHVQQQMMNFSKIQQIRFGLENADKQYSQYEKKVEESLRLSVYIDGQDDIYRAFIESATPKIPNFEVITAVVPSDDNSGIDTTKEQPKEEGLYYLNKTMSMLSESEMFEWYIPLLEELGVKICVIENITSLGSKAIEKINEYANSKGAYIFYSAMERKQEKLTIEFISQL